MSHLLCSEPIAGGDPLEVVHYTSITFDDVLRISIAESAEKVVEIESESSSSSLGYAPGQHTIVVMHVLNWPSASRRHWTSLLTCILSLSDERVSEPSSVVAGTVEGVVLTESAQLFPLGLLRVFSLILATS
jgi:hypothetical protein